jgi:hypothetical protein
MLTAADDDNDDDVDDGYWYFSFMLPSFIRLFC